MSCGSPTRSRGSGEAPDLRRRRAATRPAGGRRASRCRARAPRRGAGYLAAGRCRLPAEPDRAVRPGAPRGACLRKHRRRHAHRRPARVRAARRGGAGRPARRGGVRAALEAAARSRARTAAARAAAEAHDVRRQAERVEEVLLQLFEIGKPDLDERPDRSSSPASRASSSACS